MERSLAHIERVVSVDPIPGADKIEVATVLGWHCVVKKGEVKPGDLVLYIETDSIVPKIEYFNFMLDRKYRVKIIKLKKVYSEGILLTLDNTIKCIQDLNNKVPKDFKEGDDLTELMSIVKYESPSDKESNSVENSQKKSFLYNYLKRFKWYRKYCNRNTKGFPSWIPKTDESRCQKMPWVVKDKTKVYYVTEKMEGQSGTWWFKKIGFFKNEFGICSRTSRRKESHNSNWSTVAKTHDIKNKLKKFYKDFGIQLAIQGEVCGPGIQGNIYKLDSLKLFVFNVYNIKEKRYYNFFTAKAIVNYLGLDFVPVISEKEIIPDTVDELVKMSIGKSAIAEHQREGVVWRTYDQEVSFKVINPEYLLSSNL